MQKVEGSSPFIRSSRSPRYSGGFVVSVETTPSDVATKWQRSAAYSPRRRFFASSARTGSEPATAPLV